MTQYYAKKTSKVELLAPAGNTPSLKAAISAGCDAIYLGGKSFNARRNATNFTEDELLDGIDFAHIHGKKVFLTLNTLIKNNEIKDFISELKFVARAGFDALILQDLGAIEIIREILPDISLHASTQLSAHNVSDCIALKSLGFDRVVLAREMSLKEITKVIDSVDIETEVFVHGALCVSVSGQCYFSSALGERSANRGLCAGVCRLPFTANKTHTPKPLSKSNSDYCLSLKDLSYIDDLQLLSDIGVTSLKIEGRMKGTEYVYDSVSSYRNALDGKEYDKESLAHTFSRSGFTNSYLHENRKNLFGVRSEDDKKKTLVASAKFTQANIEVMPSIPIDMSYSFYPDTNSTLTISDQLGNVAYAEGSIPEKANNRSLDKESVEKNLCKLGDTSYELSSIDGFISPNLYCSAKDINALRRDCIEQLNKLRAEKKILSFNPQRLINLKNTSLGFSEKASEYISTVTFASQLSQELFDLSKYVSVPIFQINAIPSDMLLRNKDKIVVELPRVYFGDESNITEVLRSCLELGLQLGKAHTIGRVKLLHDLGFTILGGFGLNVLNDYSIHILEKEYAISSVTISPEISAGSLNSIYNNVSLNIIGYGNFPLMITRVCPTQNQDSDCLTDRKNINFPVIRNSESLFEVLNSQPIYLGDRISEIKNIDTVEFLFKTEDKNSCANIIKLFTKKEVLENITRGCYFRKIK